MMYWTYLWYSKW